MNLLTMKQSGCWTSRTVARWKTLLAICLVCCWLGFSVKAHAATFTTIDPPGSIYTYAWSINPAGAITGNYVHARGGGFHGFLRTPDGTFTTFDVPGSMSTDPRSINPAGAITGLYRDASGGFHSFLRSR